jgi:hypothetical protein
MTALGASIFRFTREYGLFIFISTILFSFYTFEYRSIIVEFEVTAKQFGKLQMEYTHAGQNYSIQNSRLIKVVPGDWHRVKLEISARQAIESLRWSVAQQGFEPSIRKIRLLAPRSGQSEASPQIIFPTQNLDANGSDTAAPVEFDLTNRHSLEAIVPAHLYTQPVHQKLGLIALLGIYLLFALTIDRHRLRLPGSHGGAQWSQYILAVACIVLAAVGAHQISYGSIIGDAEENLAIAFNVLHHGIYSHVISDTPLPGNLREPVPTFFYAAWLAAIGQFDHVIQLNHLWGGTGTFAVKLGNVFWIYAGLVAFSKLIDRLIPNALIGLLGLLLVFLAFFGNAQWVDSLYTELHTAVLLLWLTWFSIKAIDQSRRTDLIGVGVLAGLLILTKAIFLYVFVALALGIFLAGVLGRPRTSLQRHWREALVVLLTTMCTVAPWSIRNAVQFGSPSISSLRGGGVMSFRAMLDGMNWEEVKGLLYLNGPSSYRYLSDHLTGPPERGDFLRGGRWARLYIGPSDFQTSDKLARHQGRPQDAVSFHQKSSAEFVQRIAEARAAGSSYPERDADQAMGRDAARYFREHPVRHIAMSLPFFWAGYWGFCAGIFSGLGNLPWNRFLVTVFDALNLAAGVSLLIVAWRGLVGRNPVLLAMAAPAVLMMAAYTAVSQNLARFFAPAHPLMVLSLMWLVFASRSLGKHPRQST